MKINFSLKILFAAILFTTWNSGCKSTVDIAEKPVPISETSTHSTEQSEVDDSPVSPGKNDSLLISMERTPCYGTCPTYKFSVYKDGYTEYEGIRFVNKEGHYYTILSKENLKKINDKARDIRFYYFKDEYIDRGITDFPTTIIVYNLQGNRKQVIDGYDETPRDLKDFELFLDQIMDNSVWMKK